MEVVAFLIPLALLLGLIFIGAFIWMARSGQYDDLETPKYKMLLDDKLYDKYVKKSEEKKL
jgi:cbb3-type cytochrome oxidase maturation protein